MTQDELLAMLRHAAEHYGLHHLAALNEMRDQYHLNDKQFREKVIKILDAVSRVDDEINEATEAVAR